MKDVIDFAKKLYSTKLECGKNLLELTKYNNVSMWWCVNSLFCQYLKKVKDKDAFGKMKYHQKILFFYKKFGIFFDLIYEAGLKTVIKMHIKNHKNKKSKNKPKIMFLSLYTHWRKIRDYKTNTIKKTNAYYESILQELKDDVELLAFNSIDLAPRTGLRIMKDMLGKFYVPYKPLNIYWSIETWKEKAKAFYYFKGVYNIIKNDKKFRKNCVLKNKDIYEEVIRELDFYFSFILPRAVSYIDMSRKLIRDEKVDLIFLENEYEWGSKSSTIIPAKLENIKTLAIQHAVILPEHEGYVYKKGEISEKGSIKSPFCPMADKTAIYGSYYIELLTERSSYPKESLVVTGHPRYDILKFVDQIYSKKRFFEKYKISKNKQILSWLTQSHGMSKEENIRNLETIFKTMEKIDDAVLIIKQHPGEGKIWTDLINQYIQKYDINVILLPKTFDTYELLYVSDLMITKDSTTAAEAAALNKPIVILNLSGKPDNSDYVKEGIAKRATNQKELKFEIENLLKDDKELAKKREEYVKKNMYKIDGKSSERIAKTIKGMIRP